jgi:hypothetical protein
VAARRDRGSKAGTARKRDSAKSRPAELQARRFQRAVADRQLACGGIGGLCKIPEKQNFSRTRHNYQNRRKYQYTLDGAFYVDYLRIYEKIFSIEQHL